MLLLVSTGATQAVRYTAGLSMPVWLLPLVVARGDGDVHVLAACCLVLGLVLLGTAVVPTVRTGRAHH